MIKECIVKPILGLEKAKYVKYDKNNIDDVTSLIKESVQLYFKYHAYSDFSPYSNYFEILSKIVEGDYIVSYNNGEIEIIKQEYEFKEKFLKLENTETEVKVEKDINEIKNKDNFPFTSQYLNKEEIKNNEVFNEKVDCFQCKHCHPQKRSNGTYGECGICDFGEHRNFNIPYNDRIHNCKDFIKRSWDDYKKAAFGDDLDFTDEDKRKIDIILSNCKDPLELFAKTSVYAIRNKEWRKKWIDWEYELVKNNSKNKTIFLPELPEPKHKKYHKCRKLKHI